MIRLWLSRDKSIPIREQLGLQFRVETFNLLNTPNFAAPNTSISTWGSNGVPTTAGNFGQILATNRGFPARQIQLALKLLF